MCAALGCAAVAVLVAAGCGGQQPHRAAPRHGGTLRLLSDAGAFAHLDPQRVYTTNALNVGRLIYRTLTAFRADPAHPGGTLTPDLATDLGRPHDRNRVWDFTLRPGAAWEDGRPVDCDQLKYGVERSFALTGGPSYPRDYLADTAGYHGPAGGPLDSVTCLDARTVRFRLNRPAGDFRYVLTLPVFSPVRPDRDTGPGYDQRPFSDGPYRVAAGTGDRLTLVRNPHWDPASDRIRSAWPDRVEVEFGTDPVRGTHDLIDDTGPNRDAVQFDFNVPATYVQQVINDPVLSARTAAGHTGAVRYLAINTRTVPDLRCRQALEYALDREAYRDVMGGATFGDYTTTMLLPGMPSYQGFDVYGGAAHTDGDVTAGRRLRTAAGDCPDRLTLDFQDLPAYQQAAQTIIDSYQRIGIQVIGRAIPKSRYYTVIGTPAGQDDLVLAAWVPDWPSGSAVLPALFDGRLLAGNAAGGNYNFSLLSDRRIDEMISSAQDQSDLTRQNTEWSAIDRATAQRAAAVPILAEKGLSLHGSAVHGAYLQLQYGEPDVLSMWVDG
jgi:peptide/nickel transport system substrate-binding protein